jgi:hypothetical protein
VVKSHRHLFNDSHRGGRMTPQRLTTTRDSVLQAMHQQRAAALEDLLAFATRDLRAASPREQRAAANLVESWHRRALLEGAGVRPPDDRPRPQPTATMALVRRVHTELRRALLTLFPVHNDQRWERRLWRPPLRNAHGLGLERYHRRLTRVVEARWPDTIWIAVMGLLEEFGAQLVRCPSCAEHRLFLKRKRQAYCSRACSQRARSARWYESHQAEALERRHEAYKRRVLKGRKGVVVRRPRQVHP